MKKLADNKGSMYVWLLIVVIMILTIFSLIYEVGRIFSTQALLSYKLQNAVNSSVNFAILDNYRADEISAMDTNIARAEFQDYLTNQMQLDASNRFTDADGDMIYQLNITSITTQSSPPKIEVVGEMIIPLWHGELQGQTVSIAFDVIGQNIRLD
jgi:predicted nucleotide-binding protein (sugar kinase/HSP70/actin superfamily)